MSRLVGPTSYFLNGTYEFSELVLARMVLLMDQSRSVLPLRSAKARVFGELWREKCTRALDLARTSSFRPTRTDKWKGIIVCKILLNMCLNVGIREPRGSYKTKKESTHSSNCVLQDFDKLSSSSAVIMLATLSTISSTSGGNGNLMRT